MNGVAGDSQPSDRGAVGVVAVAWMPTLGPPGLAWLLCKLQPHQRRRFATAATRSHRQHGKALQLGQGQVGVALAGEAEAAIPQPPELGMEPIVRA